MYIEFPWQTRVEVRSAQHPESLVGEALNGVIMSESAKHREDTFERYIRPALADYRGWATFPTTPEGQNWYYQLWRLGRDDTLPEYMSWRFPSWTNTVLYPGGRQDPEIILIERTTSPEWFEQEIGADFTAFVGKIFGEFQEDVHVPRGGVHYNPDWPNYIGFDWGFVNPLAAIEFQVDPQDNIHVWREHYKSYTILSEHMNLMRNRVQPPGYRIDMCFGDAADPGAVVEVASEFAPCIAMPEAKENWREGIELVKTFLREYEIGKQDEYGTPQTAPKMFVDHSCLNLIREFNNYKAPNPTRGNNPRSPRETAQGIDDHALDALRYGLMHIFKLGAKAGMSLADTMGGRYRPSMGEDVYNLVSTGSDAGVFSGSMEF
jgi:hypothetical protein